MVQTAFTFDGRTFDPALDTERLSTQLVSVYRLMEDHKWRSLREIADATGKPEASISARLRDLRKLRFGSHEVERRRRGNAKDGVFEYRLEEE